MFVSQVDDGLLAGVFHTGQTDGSAAGEVHLLPADLETIPPGPFLGSILSVVDPGSLVGRDVVRYVQAQARLVSHHQASYYIGITELARATHATTTERDTVPNEFASDELAAAVAKTRRAAEADVDLALDLRYRLPSVWKALEAGKIDLAKARVFSQELVTLHTRHIPVVVDSLVDSAADLTTGQLRTRLKKAVLEADLEAAQIQYELGLGDRKLVVYPNPDHTASMALASVDPLEAVAAGNHVHHVALELKRLPGESRTIDQLKADVAIDLLQGKTTHVSDGTSIQPNRVVVRSTSDSPTGHITGYGPVLTTTTASETPPAEKDDRVGDCHHTEARKPTKTQIQHIVGRYPSCIHPGCRMPANQCDIDHRRPWHNGGKTSCANLAPLCRHHHRCKDQGGWRLQRNPDDSHTWTSPLGHTYTTERPP